MVKKTLQYVQERSPFYREHFSAAKCRLTDLKNLEDLRKIPFTTKDHLQQRNTEFICVDRSRLIDYVSTSGTTGMAITIALTHNDLERLAVNEEQSFRTAGVDSTDLIQLMTTMDRRFMAGLAYFLGARRLGAGVIRVGNGLPEMQWQNILQLKPSVLVCVPSFLIKLLDYARENGIDPNSSSVRKAICIGEPIRNRDLSLNVLGRKIEERWGIALHSTYASTEMASAFTECSAGLGGHLQEELVHIELIGENDQPVAAGEEGELVITTLGIEGMPLVRYRTGDVCRAHMEPCTCGRNSLRLGPILGRKQQMIKLKGTTLYPGAIYEVLERFSEVENYQVVVQNNEINTDHLTIHLGTEKPSPALEARISESLRATLRVLPEIRTHSVKAVNELLFPPGSRKPVKFADRRR